MKKTILFLPLVALSLFSCGQQSFDNSKLIIGMECGYAPFNWTEVSENEYTLPISNAPGYADGYDIQIAKYLGEQLNVEVEIKKLQWEALQTSMVVGDINCIIAGMSYDEDRDIVIDFTNNYYVSQMTVVVRADSDLVDITSISELAGYGVVSQRGTLTYDIIDQIEGVNKLPALDSFDLAAVAVSTGSADAMTAEYPVARAIVNAYPDLALVTFNVEDGFQGLDANSLGVAVGIQEGNAELQEKINSALAQLDEQERNEMMDDAISRAPAAESE